MVVVPVIFNDQATVSALIDKLEIAWLANQDEHLHFALLSDFADGPTEEVFGDKKLSTLPQPASNSLTSDTAKESRSFHLFHRSRQWCETKEWSRLGRKRGKLREFNRLLRRASDTSFILATGSPDFTGSDSLCHHPRRRHPVPRDAPRLIGAAIHPLNWPVLIPSPNDRRRLWDPPARVSISLKRIAIVVRARLSGNTGIDPYTTAAWTFTRIFSVKSYTGKVSTMLTLSRKPSGIESRTTLY